MGEEGIFHENDGRGGVLVPQDAVKLLSVFPDAFRLGIGNVVQHKGGGLLHGCHEPGNLQVQEGVSAESEVNDGAVYAAGEDIGMGHARTRGAAALQDRGAVHHDGAVGDRALNCGLLQGVSFRNTQLQGFHFVVKGQVQHVFTRCGLHVAHQFFLVVCLDGAPFEARAHEPPLPVYPGIEVQAAHGAVGHVRHVVTRIGPAGIDGGRAGAEADIEAGRVGAQVPQTVPDNAVQAFRQAAVAGAFFAVRFAINRESGSVCIHISFLCQGCKTAQEEGGNTQQQFFHLRQFIWYKNTNF